MAVARLRPIAAALLALSLGAASRAAPVTWSFTGTIVSGVGTVGSTPATSFVGAPIGGTIRLDDATADSSADPSSGLYLNSVPPGEFRVQVGGAVFSAPVGFYVGVTNDSAVFSGADILGVNRLQAFPYPGLPGLWVDYFSITLFDSSGTVFSSDALPSPPPSVASFDPGSRSMDV